MDRLRTPFLILATIFSLLIVLIETGTAIPGIVPNSPLPLTSFQLPASVSDGIAHINSDQQNVLNQLKQQNRPPGLAVPDQALLDSIVLFTIVLMGVALLITDRLQGRVQGIATLIFSLIVLIIAIAQILAAISSLILMVSLLLAIPFGTIIYLIIYGSFNRAGTDIALSLIMLLKFGTAVSLFLAQQRFLQSIGLVLLIVTSLLSNVIVSFLIGLVPGILVSITDAIAAIVVSILAVAWALFLLVGAIISIIKLLPVGHS